MKMTVSQRIEVLRRVFPNIDAGNARYLYAADKDLRRSGSRVAVLALLWSADGRTSIHKNTFNSKGHRSLTVPAWAAELDSRVPDVYRNFIVPAISEQSGVSWYVDRIIGWHFVKAPTKRERANKPVRRGRK